MTEGRCDTCGAILDIAWNNTLGKYIPHNDLKDCVKALVEIVSTLKTKLNRVDDDLDNLQDKWDGHYSDED